MHVCDTPKTTAHLQQESQSLNAPAVAATHSLKSSDSGSMYTKGYVAMTEEEHQRKQREANSNDKDDAWHKQLSVNCLRFEATAALGLLRVLCCGCYCDGLHIITGLYTITVAVTDLLLWHNVIDFCRKAKKKKATTSKAHKHQRHQNSAAANLT